MRIFLNSQMAIDFYKEMAQSSVTTAFAAGLRANPAIYDIEGFSNYYHLIPLLACLATGFILSSVFCRFIEEFVEVIYTIVNYYFRKLPAILKGTQALFCEFKINPSPQVLLKAIKDAVNASLEVFDKKGLICASRLFTILILVNLSVNHWPALGERLANMHIATWFSPEHGFSYILTSVLGAMFNI